MIKPDSGQGTSPNEDASWGTATTSPAQSILGGNMLGGDSTEGDARAILLEQKKLQDAVATIIKYVPGILHVLTSFVYTTMLFFVRGPLIFPVWIAFSVQLIAISLIFDLRSIMAERSQRFYEAAVLRRPSDSYSTIEMVWTDRLAETRQFKKYEHRDLLRIFELGLWLGFATMVYFLTRHYS
jgi:hypothetical protein